MALTIGRVLGNRYEIIGKIGSGGMSDVYKALDGKLNRSVAIKVLKNEFAQDQTFVAKFRMEAQSAACLSNPNIVKIFDVGEEDGIYFIVMEYIDGITLKKYIDRRGKLGIREAIEVALQVSYGLEAAHGEHIVHRDIKPQNIMISKEGKVFVTDFGIARAISSHTIRENTMGSAHYISPEQAKGGNCDERSDIYSLGITMYEMLTGRVPFEGDSTVAVALLHIQGEMVPPSSYEPLIPISLEKIILKCTRKKPEDRYATATELITDLKRALTSPNEDFVNLNIDSEEVRAEKAKPLNAVPVPAAAASANGATKDISTDELKKALEVEAEKAKAEKASREEYEEDPEDIDDEEETEARFEKLVTYIGIGVAAVIVIILLIVGIKACGLFDFSSSSSTESTEEGDLVMIDLKGKTYEEADRLLVDMGLSIKASYAENADYPDGQIFEQDIAAGQPVQKGQVISVSISTGTNAILIPPDLSGKSPEYVKSTLRSAGFTNVSDSYIEEASDTVDKGLVIRTEPGTGQRAPKEALIKIVVSSGKAVNMVLVPSLLDISESAAKERLTSANLKAGEIKYEYSENTEKGEVMLQDIPEGTEVEEQTAVGFTVSKGPKETEPERVKVPSLEGKTLYEAKSLLNSIGLKVGEQEYEYDDEVTAGQIIGQTPTAGKKAEVGTVVDVVISLGPASSSTESTQEVGGD